MRKFFSVMRKPKINIAASAVCFSVLSAVLLATGGADLFAEAGMKIREMSSDFSEDRRLYEGTDENEIRFERFRSEKTDENVPWLKGGYITEENEKTGSLPIIERFSRGADYMDHAEGIYVINEHGIDFDISDLLKKTPPAIPVKGADEPQILIVHTHTTECYHSGSTDSYDKNETFRTEDPNENMINIGNIIEKSLTEAGYSVIHSETVHDLDYNHSYSSSYADITSHKQKYPSIKVVLDVHRDSLLASDGTRYKTVASLNGEKSAQLMFLVGAGNATYTFPTWQNNFSLAIHIQDTANRLYPTLMRPMIVSNSRFNQHLTDGSMLIEVGSDANSKEEAERAAEYFADAMITYFDSEQ
ncbi:MAG: stage II sporulation protein P [Eubacteriales bacterium]|nr:stage II sporulation protein P [Eubacteriales bacterium]